MVLTHNFSGAPTVQVGRLFFSYGKKERFVQIKSAGMVLIRVSYGGSDEV